MNRRQFLMALMLGAYAFKAGAETLNPEDIGQLRTSGLDGELLESYFVRHYLNAIKTNQPVNSVETSKGKVVHYRVLPATLPVHTLLTSLASPLWKTASRKLDWRIYLTDSPLINAFTPGGGLIFINAGLVKLCEKEVELACVIAHEIGHIENRHAVKGILTQAVRKNIDLPLGPGKTGKEDNQAFYDWHLFMAGRGYTRHWEYQADAFIVHAFRKTGYPVSESGAFFKQLTRLVGAAAKESVYSCLFSTHPANQDRLKRVESIAGTYPDVSPKPESREFLLLKELVQKL